MKNGKYPEGIEEMRRKKNEIISKNESTKKLKRKATTKLDDAKRHFRNLVKKDTKHKLCEYELNGKKYISLKRNWTHAIKKNEDNKDIKRRSRSLDNQHRNSINEWLITTDALQTS